MKKIPIQLYSDQWQRFRNCIAACIAEIQEDINIAEEKNQIVWLKLHASLLNEMLIRIDMLIAKQASKNTMSLTLPQALALHSLYTELYLRSNDLYFSSILQTKIITTIDKAV